MHNQPDDIVALLALQGSNTQLGLAGRCEAGQPMESLEAQAIYGPYRQALSDIQIFSESSLYRLGKQSPEERDRVIRLAATWQMVWNRFLDSDAAIPDDGPSAPWRFQAIEVSRANASGGQAVEEFLGRLKYVLITMVNATLPKRARLSFRL